MLSSFTWETYKLLKRPAIWVSIAILLLLAIGLGYLFTWVIYTHPPRGASASLPRGIRLSDLKVALYPPAFVKQTLDRMASLGGVFALILGVLSQGSEYGWGTVKTIYTQRPGRLALLAGKIASLALVVLLMVGLLFAVDLLCSIGVASIDGKAVALPPGKEIGEGLLAAWLIFGFWAMLGFTLATLFRQSAMAIGLGLAYAILVEGIILNVLGSLGGDLAKQIQSFFPIANTGYLVSSFGRPFELGPPPPKPYADATHAVVYLLAYLAVFTVACAVVLRRRDVT